MLCLCVLWVQGGNKKKLENVCLVWDGGHHRALVRTHPCLRVLLVPFFDCRLSNDLVA